MGVFSKLKNIFYDEEYIDEPGTIAKKEIKESKPKVEELKPTPKVVEIEDKEEVKKVENKTENTFSERELFRSERTFNFTEFDEEEDLPPRRNVLDLDKTSKVSTQATAPVEQPRVFKPSPIISPIYGILDKDYVKEEVVSKPIKSEEKSGKTMTYDSVRRKAYGTLEDDLEDTLNSMSKITAATISESVNDIDASIKELDEKTNKIEDLIGKIESSTVSIGDLEHKAKDEMFDDEDEDIEDKTMTDSTLEHDLFNLIDSMYEDKED
jgi:hypothetical protein